MVNKLHVQVIADKRLFPKTQTCLSSVNMRDLTIIPTVSLVPRPRPPGEGKGLVTIARFLVCAEPAVLFSRQPIRLLGLKISCDVKRPCTADWFRNLNGCGAHHMIVRFCYAVYLQLLNQHN